MTTTEFTNRFPGTHVTNWTDDEGFDMVTIGVPGLETSSLFVEDYEHVLTVWDSFDGHIAPRTSDPLYVALENLLEFGFADVTPEVTSVRETPRNVWVTFANGYPTSVTHRDSLIDMALSATPRTDERMFPNRGHFHSIRVTGSSVDRSALVILHKVDPES